MKRILAGIALALSTLVSAATLAPVQLLNPAGSTSGQAIVSSGPSSAPAWGNVAATALAPVAANTVIANPTGSTSAPAAHAVPSCSTANSALKWTSGTGLSCGTTFALTSGNLSQFASTTSAQLLGVLSDETGTGVAVFSASPALTGTPTAPTAAVGTNTTQVATTAFVQATVGKPYFQATLSSNQSVTVATQTKVTFNTAALDSGSYFSTGTNRFTPLVAGKYRVAVILTAQSTVTGAGNQLGVAYVYKNGAQVCGAGQNYYAPGAGNVFPWPSVTCIVTLNGTTDYVEAWGYVGGNSAGQFTASGSGGVTLFEAEYIGQ